MKYVIDTNIFNWLIDGIIEFCDLPKDATFVVTHIQIDELNETSDKGRRAVLFTQLVDLKPEKVSTESFVLDISRFGNAKLGDGTTYKELKSELDALNNNKSNNSKDALIAEVAIKNGYILLTADRDLAEVVQKRGCQTKLYGPPFKPRG